MNKLLYLTVFFTVLCLQSNAQSSSFVSVKKDHFYLDNRSYYYIGTNYWYGRLLGLSNSESGIKRLRKELDYLTSQGIYVLRVLAGAEGSGLVNGVQRVGPPLQPEKGKFDKKVIESLDVLLYEMGKRNMKAVLYLSNNWEWSGGFLQYLRWNDQIPDSVFRRKLKWDEMRDYVSKFYTCSSCKDDYLKQVTYILSHTNKFSKKRYVDDPAIMAWELANEPRPMRPSSNDAYKQWISNVAGVIKSKDHNHLVTTGNEGEMGMENMQLFEDIHADKNIDYLTIHIWPKNWSWFTDTSIAKDFSRVISNSENYIAKHVAIAEKLQKPLVLEEFGLPRNNQLFDINSNTSLRDNYYNKIFSIWQKSKSSKGVIGGASFWAFGGIARPHPNQVFWKEGDDYMGDPPMEEQGLNTVFDSDSSTWKVINSYTKNKSPGSFINDLPADKQATRQTISPYKGQVSEKNFIKFYEEDKTLFQKDITKQKLYQPE